MSVEADAVEIRINEAASAAPARPETPRLGSIANPRRIKWASAQGS